MQPSGREAADWLCESHGANLPSAVFFANTLMAVGGLAGLYDRGIRVPQDMAVASFDHIELFEDYRPRLTSVGNSPAELGHQAATTLVERLNGLDEPPRRIAVPFSLRAFESA